MAQNGPPKTQSGIIQVLDHQLEQLADELTRRKMMQNSGKYPSSPRKISPSQFNMKQNSAIEEPDPGQLLNEWLGELDNLQKGLHTSTSLRTGAAAPINSRESSGTPVHMRRMSTPRVESPRLDSYRYSLINLEETLENDLDAILGELCALESHFPTSSSTSTASSTTSSTGTVLQRVGGSISSNNDHSDQNDHHHPNEEDLLQQQVVPQQQQPIIPPPPPPLMMSSQENIQKYLLSAEPQYITAESVRQNKLMSNSGGQQQQQQSQQQQQQKRTESPDNDSAFCDNTSSNSGSDSSQKVLNGNTNNTSNSNTTNTSSTSNNNTLNKNNLNLKLTSPTTNNGKNSSSLEDPAAQAKAEKIRLAIEKIKEASIKKIFIKVFGEDGSAKSLLVDERMTVSQVCGMLAEKNYVKRDTQWGLVELLPDLHMERAYEDHELLVENLLMWKADSKNTLWFIKRPEVFDLFCRPEMYLLGETSSQIGLEMDDRARAELIEEYFASSGVGAPEVEGFLYLKAESKKSWKKFYFVLRTSGLYYAPKGKKTSKDLVCLARFDVNQVYYGVKWQPKFKSPTRHCFAIKHPQIQAKNPKYIRYLCADSEQELNKWVTGIRVAKYGKQLYGNYRGIVEEMAHDDLDQLASSRFSADAITLATAHKNATSTSVNNNNNKASTPDSNLENKSFDSALQMSDLVNSGPSSISSSSMSSHTVSTTAMVHNGTSQALCGLPTTPRSLNGTLKSHRSNSTGSLSDKSQHSSISISLEQGFNCDSPEGGTIKKKPSLSKSAVKQNNDDCMDGNSSNKAASGKQVKGVRFKETFSTDEDHLPLPPPPLLPHEDPYTSLGPSSSSRNYTYHRHSGTPKSTHFDLEAELECLPVASINKLTRRYSDESLVSNPAMLHTGTLISNYQDFSVLSQQQQNSTNHHKNNATTSPSNPVIKSVNPVSSTNPVKSPEPNRPAPVLKPQIGRKPSIDKALLAKKLLQNDQQQHVSRQPLPSNGLKQPSQRSPSYEDTLRKCQSLTRHNSSPVQSNSTPIAAGSPVFRQTSCPIPSSPPKSTGLNSNNGSGSSTSPKPSIAPKPNASSPAVPPKPARLDSARRIVHLPPSGSIHSRSPSANGRIQIIPNQQQQQQQSNNKPIVNQAFLNDLHLAMSQKRHQPSFPNHLNGSSSNNEETDRPFPNRFSSGEYENVQHHHQPPPPLPKRNDETHLTRDRT